MVQIHVVTLNILPLPRCLSGKVILFGACVPFLDERRKSMTLMHVAELLQKYLIQCILTVATGM